jgi:hypothetical protein
MITLGRFDLSYAVSAMARFNAAPRTGHITAMKRIFGYIKKFPKGQIVIDPNQHTIPMEQDTETFDWTEFYPEATEEIPYDMPAAKGTSAKITVYVDADHAPDLVTRRSVTGILLFVNNTPVAWTSKRQKTVETSSYGSELVAARIATEMIIEYRYKLRMIGTPINGPAIMCGDNKSAIISTTIPSSQLKKKHNAITYHRIREAIAGNILRFVKVKSADNLADFLTKPLAREPFLHLVMQVLFRKPPSFSHNTDNERTDGL